MKLKLCIVFLLLTTFSLGQNRLVQDKIKFYTEKVQKYLDKEKALSAFYSINEKGISTYASSSDKLNHKTEFFIPWEKIEDFNLYCKYNDHIFEYYKQGKIEKFPDRNFEKTKKDSSAKSLQGIKIAIDPGHIAHNFESGDLEKKHLKFKQDVVHGVVDSVEIAEGILTYATGLLLKQKLEANGAEVMLTRPKGSSAFGKTFQEWKKEDLKKAIDSLFKTGEISTSQKKYFLSAEAQDRDIFRVIFRDLDLARRAELINIYKPDLTVIIHYNVDEMNLDWIKPTKKNFNMAFVGGAFMKNDLSSSEKRFEFLRLLITDDLEKSIALSSAAIESFEKNLVVPTCGEQDAKYIAESCLNAGKKGVYCRNLQLTRYIHSPLVYGETLYQDNIKESQLLNKESDKTKNERVQQVADAYFQGILNYIETKRIQ
jgi:N-acetylmuramoyl-L-alanine amidase